MNYPRGNKRENVLCKEFFIYYYYALTNGKIRAREHAKNSFVMVLIAQIVCIDIT